MQHPHAPLPPPIGTRMTSGSGEVFEDLQRVRADAGDQQRLVCGMHVAKPSDRGFVLDPFPRFVEILPVFDHRGAERAHCGVLVRIVSPRYRDDARHAGMLRRERDRLAVIAGAGGDDASRSFILARERRHEIDPAANLECPRRIVIFVFDVDVDAGFGRQQRMPHQRRAAYDAVQNSPRVFDVFE